MIQEIMNDKELLAEPPILIDIGASGDIHSRWSSIAEYSVCIAFDADDREFSIAEDKTSRYKRLYKINKMVNAQKNANTFFWTASPYCSSSLEPDPNSLEKWLFSDLFQIKKKAKMMVVTLPEVLKKMQIDYVDWFKTDSQGIDLRLFKSLGRKTFSKISVAEFEPGIIDAYRGEDKMHHVLKFMQEQNFWLSDLKLQGSKRIRKENALKYVRDQARFEGLIDSPCWGEMLYLNEAKNSKSRRDLLLRWVLSTIVNQHGFALEIAIAGNELYAKDLFEKCINHSAAQINYQTPLTKLKRKLTPIKSFFKKFFS